LLPNVESAKARGETHMLSDDLVVPIECLIGPQSSGTIPSLTDQRFDVFISHNWGPDASNHRVVKNLCNLLQAKNLKVWLDENEMNDNIDRAMSKGIDQSELVLICVTKEYHDKLNQEVNSNDNCLREFRYASNTKGGAKSLIPIVLEKEMLNQKAWRGRLQMDLGDALYFDLTADNKSQLNETGLEKLLLTIMQKLQRTNYYML
jgi:hypothetical protein